MSEHPQACYYIVAKTPPPTGSTMHALVHGLVEMRREPVGPARELRETKWREWEEIDRGWCGGFANQTESNH